jgi:fatty acid amide hydrolase 2
MPAFFNGVYGHKASSRVISNKTQHPPAHYDIQDDMLATGPICRYAVDLKLLFKVMTEPAIYKDFEKKFESNVFLIW